MARVFAKFGLRLDVELSYGVVGRDRRHPYIKAESLVQSLDRNGKLDRLLGFGPDYNTLEKCGDRLQQFWDQYRVLHPQHEVFRLADSHQISLRHCCPIYTHGDEGTTYKKDGCLVLSIHTPIGSGTRVGERMGRIGDGVGTPMHTNYIGHALETRFVLAALLRDTCQKINTFDPLVFPHVKIQIIPTCDPNRPKMT